MLTKTDIEKYFVAEKQMGLFFVVAGLVAVAVALFCWLWLKTQFWKGAAIPLLLLGLFQAFAAYTAYSRSDAQRIENVYALDMNPQQLKEKELPRMQKAGSNLVNFRWAELVLVLAGLVLIFASRTPEKQFWLGLGAALALEAVLLLTADTLAWQRAQTYTGQLEELLKKV
jgi:hypothetical protein